MTFYSLKWMGVGALAAALILGTYTAAFYKRVPQTIFAPEPPNGWTMISRT